MQQDRQKIRDYLASIDTPQKAIVGVTGSNYFDKNGDPPKPISIGVYKNNSLISALMQLQTVSNTQDIKNLQDVIAKGDIISIDEKYFHKTNIVYTGIEVNSFNNIDPKNLTYSTDFYLWFRFSGTIHPENINFLNAVVPIQLSTPEIEKVENGYIYRLYRVKGKFRMNFLPGPYLFNQYQLSLSFHHNASTNNHLLYIKDVVGMQLKTALSRMKQAHVLSNADDWTLEKLLFFRDTEQKSALGNPSYLSTGESNYSRFNMEITIKGKQFNLRGEFSFYTAELLLLLSALLFILSFVIRTKFSGLRVIVWLIYVVCAGLFLLSCEIVLVDQLSAYTELNRLVHLVITLFDILWWVAPAILLHIAAEYFIWQPLEARTQRTVPNIMRLFVAVVIYLLAFFGIVAFVYQQPLTSLLATSGMVAMIIGLAIQVNIANIFSGIAINLERPFRVGDWIKLHLNREFFEGQVLDVTWRTTRLKTREGGILSIPNSAASESMIHNYHYPDNCYKSKQVLKVSYIHSPEKIKQVLLDAIISTGIVLDEPKPEMRFKGFDGLSAEYEITYYLSDYGKRDTENEIIWSRIWVYLKQTGILPSTQEQELRIVKELTWDDNEKLLKTT